MQCLFLFKDAAGRLPTAQQLRRCGFLVSEAALPGNAAGTVCEAPNQPQAWPSLALAAEPTAVYGGRAQERAFEAAPDQTQDGARDGARDGAQYGAQDGAQDGAQGISGNPAQPQHACAGQERLHGPPQAEGAR